MGNSYWKVSVSTQCHYPRSPPLPHRSVTDMVNRFNSWEWLGVAANSTGDDGGTAADGIRGLEARRTLSEI